MKHIVLLISVYIFALGCNGSGYHIPIKIYGELFKIMHEGERDGQVSLMEILQENHVYGVGAMEGLHGEVIIWDNNVLINRSEDGESPSYQLDVTEKDYALLLVTAQVENWQKVNISETVTMQTIDAAIKKYADKSGINTSKPFPFTIEGNIEFIDWHIIDAPEPGGSHDEHMASSWRRQDKGIKGKILGFYSENHQTIFTHYSSYTHMHVLFEDENLSGHIDDLKINQHWQLSVPLLKTKTL